MAVIGLTVSDACLSIGSREPFCLAADASPPLSSKACALLIVFCDGVMVVDQKSLMAHELGFAN